MPTQQESLNKCKEWHSILNSKEFKFISAQKTFNNVILLFVERLIFVERIVKGIRFNNRRTGYSG